MFSRRQLISGVALTCTAAAIQRPTLGRADYRSTLGPTVTPVANGRTVEVALEAAERPQVFPCFGGRKLPVWTFQEGVPAPVIRLRLGETLVATLRNSLPRPGELVTIHWHGIRLPNAQDGVPYLVQPPVEPGGSYTYRFTPPDTGTYFFHTHCNSVEHFGRGLYGILIVEGDETAPCDHELVLAMKDWRIGDDGNFAPFYTSEGAAKSGTHGTVRSVNSAISPRYTVPSSADVRLRILNVDPTRIAQIGIEGAEAAVVAIDGVPCPPFALDTWRFGPATRLDVIVRTPADGGVATLTDYFSAQPVPLAVLASAGDARRTGGFDPAPLRSSIVPEPDIANATHMNFTFSSTATGASVAELASIDGFDVGSLCLSSQTFWAINKRSWVSKDHRNTGPPLAKLDRGKSYVFELENVTAQSHPIHIHGHTFKVLGSNKRKLPPHHADTVLVGPRERVDVAFVADNPGNWMFHCHILEHQESGMMGYLTVT
jgi:FtsP/CotA-like multicopper oxidase with cupredoxin domain